MTPRTTYGFIHDHAVVDVTVQLGQRVRVWQFASVIRHAIVGDDCSIASCAIVDGSRLGQRCIVSHGAFLDPGMAIGDDVFIGPHVALCNDFWPRVDKRGFDLDALVRGEIVTTRIDDGASLGAGVIVLPGTNIGRYAMIAAGAVVTQDVPALHLYRRDGSCEPITPGKVVRRVRAAHRDLPVGAKQE